MELEAHPSTRTAAAPAPVHAWLVMLKASNAMARCVLGELSQTGLCDSDFRVLEALLHKGPLPVNAIGAKVFLTPGSISVAIDRLVARGYVKREESAGDRRVRLVALTSCGKALIEPIFARQVALMDKLFAEFSPDELQAFEALVKRVGFRAAAHARKCPSLATNEE